MVGFVHFGTSFQVLGVGVIAVVTQKHAKIGFCNCRAAALAFEVVRTGRDQVEVEAASPEWGSRCLVVHFVQKSLSLFAWKEFEEP